MEMNMGGTTRDVLTDSTIADYSDVLSWCGDVMGFGLLYRVTQLSAYMSPNMKNTISFQLSLTTLLALSFSLTGFSCS